MVVCSADSLLPGPSLGNAVAKELVITISEHPVKLLLNVDVSHGSTAVRAVAGSPSVAVASGVLDGLAILGRFLEVVVVLTASQSAEVTASRIRMRVMAQGKLRGVPTIS